MKKYCYTLIICCFLILPVSVSAMARCKMSYDLRGWSFIYREYRGTGHIRCDNGQEAYVSIISRSGGFTLGKSEIINGVGVISEVKDIREVFGTYVFIDSHAGAIKSIEGRVMTKGEISLALTGTGRGFDLGFTLGAFTIRPQEPK